MSLSDLCVVYNCIYEDKSADTIYSDTTTLSLLTERENCETKDVDIFTVQVKLKCSYLHYTRHPLTKLQLYDRRSIDHYRLRFTFNYNADLPYCSHNDFNLQLYKKALVF